MSIPTHDRTVRTSSPGTRDSGNNRKKTINPEAGTTGTGTVWKPYGNRMKPYGNRMGTVWNPYMDRVPGDRKGDRMPDRMETVRNRMGTV